MFDNDFGAEHRDDNDILKGGVATIIAFAILASVNVKLESVSKKKDDDNIPTTKIEEITKDNLIPSESALAELTTTIPQTTNPTELNSSLTGEEVEKIRADLNEMFAFTGLHDIYKPFLIDYYKDDGLTLCAYIDSNDNAEADKLTNFIVEFCQKYNITNLDLHEKIANLLPNDFATSIKILSVHKEDGNDVINLEKFTHLVEFTSFGVHFRNLVSCTNLKEFSLLNQDGYDCYYDYYDELKQLEDLSFVVGELDYISIKDISITGTLPVSKLIAVAINQSFNQTINLSETDNLILDIATFGTPKITITGKVNSSIHCHGDGSLNLENLDGQPKLYDEKGEVSYKKEQAFILVRNND